MSVRASGAVAADCSTMVKKTGSVTRLLTRSVTQTPVMPA